MFPKIGVTINYDLGYIFFPINLKLLLYFIWNKSRIFSNPAFSLKFQGCPCMSISWFVITWFTNCPLNFIQPRQDESLIYNTEILALLAEPCLISSIIDSYLNDLWSDKNLRFRFRKYYGIPFWFVRSTRQWGFAGTL